MSRRELLTAAASACVSAALPSATACAPVVAPRDLPSTGRSAPEYAVFEDWARTFVAEHRVPGASLAIARDGEIVCALGLGVADRDARTPVEPESLFRIASVSKPITAVALLKLVEDGRLRLADKLLDHLEVEPFLPPDAHFDERWKQVKIVHCLSHTGGWDRNASYDPMYATLSMSRQMRIPLPLGAAEILRYQLGRPLDFDPGSRWVYSNFGFSVLGRVIEGITGEPYEAFVRRAILAPLGLDRPRIGGSLESDRLPAEVAYYSGDRERAVAVTGPGAGQARVPICYGSWRQEANDANGGWIASAVDLVRFGAALDRIYGGRKTRGGLLTAETARIMFSAHATVSRAQDGRPASSYGLGWFLNRGDASHSGAMSSTAAVLIHAKDGLNLAFLTNLGRFRGGMLGHQVAAPLLRLIVEERALGMKSGNGA